MDMSVWAQYKYDTENNIVQSLLQEEIDKQSRYREQISFRCVEKKRIRTALFWGIPTLVLLLNYLFKGPLGRSPGGVVPVMILALIWMIRVCMVGNKNAAKYLVRDAVKSPATPFSQLVEENIREKTGLTGSKMIHCLLCLAVMLGSLAIPVTDRLGEMRVDGMIFRDYQNGCILVDCVSDFKTAQVVIPERVQGKTVIAIDSGAFMGERDIVSVSIPNTVTSVGAEAFSGCTKLESIVIPQSVTEIRGNCFENCRSLTQVVLHEGISSIHGYAFRNCSSLESITLPSGITEVRSYCFENCTRLKSIVIPEGVTRIGAHAFMGCKALESVTVPSTVREIGSSAFRQCTNLKRIEIPEEAAVDERSFKESPTEVIRYDFTQVQMAAIEDEVLNREPDVVYFFYEPEKGADTIYFPSSEGVIIIADDPRFLEYLKDGFEVQSMENYAEVLAYLEKAQAQGAKTVEYNMYSQIGSDIKGKTMFFYVEHLVDDMIRHIKNEMVEE